MATLNEFQSSMETTRKWVSDLMLALDTYDEAWACRAFRAVVHELRDNLTVEEAADLAAQLPMLLKGLYYEGWRPSAAREKTKAKSEFLAKVAEQLVEIEDYGEIEKIVENVFRFLSHRVSEGEISDVVRSLPKQVRGLWPVGLAV